MITQNTIPTRQQIESLHRTYIAETGQQISLNMARESEWFEWMRAVKPAVQQRQITKEAAIRLVVAHIRRGIRDGRRNDGALKFRNLIGQPDYFEEDLAMAVALDRRPKVDTGKAAVLEASGRTGQPESLPVRTAQDVIQSQAFKDMVKFKEQLYNQST